MDYPLWEYALVAIAVLVLLGFLYSVSRPRRKIAAQVVVIREGKLLGEPANGMVCPTCGRKFKHTIMFDEEIVKCPYCGSEVM
jgi:rRNA maturation endonuclease Nob1